MKKSFALLLVGLVTASNAFGAIPLFEKEGKSFELFGDVRYRYEMQSDDSKSDPDGQNRVRERGRFRIGGVYKASERIEAGFRLATGSTSRQSPHQTYAEGGVAKNGDFGLDRAYVKYKAKTMDLTLGKQKMPLTQFLNSLHDEDISPEGMTLRYESDIANLLVGRYIAQYNSFHAANDGYNLIGLDGDAKMGGMKLGWALNSMMVTESPRDAADALDAIPGGSAMYNYFGLQGKMDSLKVALQLLNSTVAKEQMATDTTTLDGSENSGSTISIGYKINESWAIGLDNYNLGYASLAMLGAWGQDDMPYSSNISGNRLAIKYDTGLGMKIDLKYMTAQAINPDLALDVHSDTNAMKGTKNVTRTQLNFNVKF